MRQKCLVSTAPPRRSLKWLQSHTYKQESGVETLRGWQRLWQGSGSQLRVQGQLAMCTGRGSGEGKDHLCLPGNPRRYCGKQAGFWSALGKRKFGRSDLTFSSHTTHSHPTHTHLQVLESDGHGICPYSWQLLCGWSNLPVPQFTQLYMEDNSTFLAELVRRMNNT